MKHCMAVTEVLTRTVIVDTKEAGADNLEKAINCVRNAYNVQEIILDADDLESDYTAGKLASFCAADWIDPNEI